MVLTALAALVMPAALLTGAGKLWTPQALRMQVTSESGPQFSGHYSELLGVYHVVPQVVLEVRQGLQSAMQSYHQPHQPVLAAFETIRSRLPCSLTPVADESVLQVDCMPADDRDEAFYAEVRTSTTAAALLAGLDMPPVVLQAALLIPAVRSKYLSLDEVEEEFGFEVHNLVHIALPTLAEEGATAVVKAMSSDWRVAVLHLADISAQIKRIGSTASPEEKSALARQALHFYAPLASQCDMGMLQTELQSQALDLLFPSTYMLLGMRLLHEELLRHQASWKAELEELLADEKIGAALGMVAFQWSRHTQARSRSWLQRLLASPRHFEDKVV